MQSESSNPFSTRFTRPGALPFIFLDERENLPLLVERLRDANWRGQIIGPHGSGKSTLLESLRPLVEAEGRQWLHVALHDGQRKHPAGFTPREQLTAQGQLVIDGYEQLGWPARWRLSWLCRRHGCGLLVTAHADAGLPEVYRTRTNLELTQRLVNELCSRLGDVPAASVIAAAFEGSRGDVRETFFTLYDLTGKRTS